MKYSHIAITVKPAPLDVMLSEQHQSEVNKELNLANAAPELLAALIRVLDEAILPSKAISDIYQVAQKAIAKATGE